MFPPPDPGQLYRQQPYDYQPRPYADSYQQAGTFPPPRRSGGGIKVLLLAAIGLFFVIGLAASLASHLSDSPEDGETYQPWPPSGRTVPQTAPTTAVPAPDMHPSDLPQPDTYAQADKWMKNNALYDESIMVPTNCAVDPVNIQTASTNTLEKHLNELTACLWTVWDPPVTATGDELPRPPVTVYTSSITTACGKLNDVNAVYCGGDQRIYYAKQLYKIVPSSLRSTPFIADTVIAHEFGHTIQARTGILVSESAWEQRSTTSDSSALELSRRLEMQADCFAGMFTSSVAQANDLSASDLNKLGSMIHNLGDDVLTGEPGYVDNHGSGDARETWFTAGQSSSQIATCNTFSAPSSSVR